MTLTNRQWLLARRPEASLALEDFEYTAIDFPELILD